MARGQRWIGLKRNRRLENVFCAEGRSEETQDAVVTPHAVCSRHGMEIGRPYEQRLTLPYLAGLAARLTRWCEPR